MPADSDAPPTFSELPAIVKLALSASLVPLPADRLYMMACASVADRVAMVDVLVAALLVMVVLSKPRPVGLLLSTVMLSPVEAVDSLLAASAALAVRVCGPADRVDDVIDQLPPVAVPVPSTVVPSVS